jgi:hypothetical protein
MLVCQWHLDIVYGKQAEAVRIATSTSRTYASAEKSREGQGPKENSREKEDRNQGD